MSKKSSVVTLGLLEKKFKDDYIIAVPSFIFNKLNKYWEKDYTQNYTNISTAILGKSDKYIEAKLKLGMIELSVKCIKNNISNCVQFSSEIFNILGISEKIKTNINVKNNVLRLGPVIGVFLSNGIINKANIQKPHFRIKELMNCNKEANTILYYFSIKDVDFIKQRISGTYFNENTNSWERKEFPFPDSLYDRGGGTLLKQKIISGYIRNQLEKNRNLKKINSTHYFDKWNTYKKLCEDEIMNKYLPLTKLYKRPNDLINMFEESSKIYIKDRNGSNGRGVACVIKSSNNTYEISYFDKKIMEYKLESFEELVEKIDVLFKDKKVIIQKAIDVIKIKNSNVDMRATVQKNGEGKLDIVAFPVRIGREKSPVTSTKTGSSVYKFEKFFSEFLNYNQEQIYNLTKKVNEFLILTYKCIESKFGSFGEIGIDFAIDKNGDIWFIECNSKPGKDTLYMVGDREIIKKSFLNPLEYAKYICEF